MMEYVNLIISKVGTREREEDGGLKVGRSDGYRASWTAEKGPQYWIASEIPVESREHGGLVQRLRGSLTEVTC